MSDGALNLKRSKRRQLLVRLDRRKLLFYAALTGLVAGAISSVFHVLVDWIAERAPDAALAYWQSGPLAAVLLVLAGMCLGGGASWLTIRVAPEAAGSGIPRVKIVLLGFRVLRPGKVLAVKLGAGLMALGAGMSLGREGPTIHMGAACAGLIARWSRLPARAMAPLIAAGSGAGLAAAFNAPLAGFLFVMEELRRAFSPVTYGTVLIAAVGAVAVTRLSLGETLSFNVPAMLTYELGLLPLAVLVGVAGVGIGWLFNASLMNAMTLRDRLGISPVLVGALAGGTGALLLVFWPAIAFGGHTLAEDAVDGSLLNAGTMAIVALLLGKFAFTILCYASSAPGGIFLPLLTIGGLLGALLSSAIALVAPQFAVSPALLGVLGMASVLTGSVRAPLTSVVLIVEMTGEYHLVYSLLVAAFTTYALGEAFGVTGIYERLVARDIKRHGPSHSDESAVVETMVEPGSTLDGRRIDRLGWPRGLSIAAIDREGVALGAYGTTRLQAGDVLTILVAPGSDRRQLASILGGHPT